MTCDLCRARGGRTWPGSEPRCGFDEAGGFASDNWNCATLNVLRELGDLTECYGEDNRACLVPDDMGDFIVLRWYKRRGKVDCAVLLGLDGTRALDLATAERAIGPGRMARERRELLEDRAAWEREGAT